MKRNRDSPRVLNLKVDRYNLERECERLADDYGYWGKKFALAKKAVAKAKAELKLTEAELTLAIRMNHGRFGFASRPSDKMVEMKVLTTEDYKAATAALTEAQYELDQYEVALNGLNHKRPMIEQLSYQHGQSYFNSRPLGVKRKRGREDG